jgi:hypothetical protein
MLFGLGKQQRESLKSRLFGDQPVSGSASEDDGEEIDDNPRPIRSRRRTYCVGQNVTTKAYYFGKKWAVEKFKRAARTAIVRSGVIVAAGGTDKTWLVQWPKTDGDSECDRKTDMFEEYTHL